MDKVNWNKIFKAAVSLFIVVCITIACYGSTQTGDTFFIVVGILAFVFWCVIVGRSYMHDYGENPKHNNYL